MEKIELFGLFIVGLLLLICFYKYLDNLDTFDLKCVVSGVDGNKYCVRERKNLNSAADLLAKTTQKCKKLVEYLNEKHGSQENVKRLVNGFNPKQIMETLPTSSYTAYSENKGEKIAFCLNTTKEGNKLIDINTLTFVALHELSHIMTESIGHKQEFWQNFKFLLENAKSAEVYNPVDYKKNPQSYCGMTINDNPLYDL
jgi:hypothetical protein